MHQFILNRSGAVKHIDERCSADISSNIFVSYTI